MANMPPDPARPKNQQGIFWIFLLFLIVAAGGAAFLYYESDWRVPAEMKSLKNPVPATKEAIGAAAKIYAQRCQSCHGEKGNGKGSNAEKLSVAPADFTDAAGMSRVTDGELYWKITRGRRPMPGFKDKLTDEERWELVDYIRTFAQKAPAGAPAQP
ncbi:MAG: cytochrome c [Candidatus Acidiferrales bacterium]